MLDVYCVSFIEIAVVKKESTVQEEFTGHHG